MKCLSYLLVVVCVLAVQASPLRAQDRASSPAPAQADHAPRAYGVMLGGNYAFLSKLPLLEGKGQYRPAGVQLGGRFGWQVRGLRGGAPSTIGMEADFLYLPGRKDARDAYGLIYGVFAKHSFTQLRVRPFFTYGLGAGQIWVSRVHGRGIGHVTRLAFGVDVRLRERTHLTIALSYQGILMPRFALDDAPAHDTSVHAGVLTTGIWFGS